MSNIVVSCPDHTPSRGETAGWLNAMRKTQSESAEAPKRLEEGPRLHILNSESALRSYQLELPVVYSMCVNWGKHVVIRRPVRARPGL